MHAWVIYYPAANLKTLVVALDNEPKVNNNEIKAGDSFTDSVA